ncbi:NAD-dependent epimerase/dehydratase family protein [Danxiaibacter flavus]|uniref:NAD-dependent epimerase/dehydratase family protein n=1 Tax=Danxiaibacter flavus TaxID=3049108 RepID=A0ABV3ZJ65_9BACT|nr:NAD-dependent epimerase/dehydratase family protein [Chitinophagaceae bacterium DXS]
MKTTLANAKILVTGGAGFIGSYVVKLLLKNEASSVVILDNLCRGSHENMRNFISDPRVTFVEGDIRNKELLEACIHGTDYIFHMAALRINACAANPSDGFDVMIKATFELAQLCVKHHVKKVIYSSSASVYGLAQHFPTPETDNPYDNQTFYGAAKLWGEQLFRNYFFMYGLDYVALRYFNVYGPGMDTDGKYTEVMIKWLDCIHNNKNPLIYGDGSTTMDFVYVKDVAEANVRALLSDITDETFNIGTGVETSLKELLELMLKVNDSTLQPEFREQNLVNPVSRRRADTTKAANMLGFQASFSIENGLADLSKWYFQRKTQYVTD